MERVGLEQGSLVNGLAAALGCRRPGRERWAAETRETQRRWVGDQVGCAARVLAAFFAAAFRRAGPFVRTALSAAALRSAGFLWAAAAFASRERARGEAAVCPSRLSAPSAARERFGEGRDGWRRAPSTRPRALSLVALRRVFSDVLPGAGGGNATPARRAFDSPIAMACFAERAPCLPSRTCSISSFTNSPAWVEGAFPSALSRAARSRTCFSGMRAVLSRDAPSTFRARARQERRQNEAPARARVPGSAGFRGPDRVRRTVPSYRRVVRDIRRTATAFTKPSHLCFGRMRRH